ncbi:carboxypeptidase-like regulatory domain-containing protein [Aquimarina litoralis]|uniref:carboxypeptidase-like regulatory domain-containing protein n=1 Tax=Aquimarina litoralis TaxID=584605 RepID=UPI001C596EC1|nr:carboxypeptidase-like regulatory domain-containing protein [Aquimarina litoralis]MBW1296161.1 hypothetical protein [Aquimarina litoralis]
MIRIVKENNMYRFASLFLMKINALILFLFFTFSGFGQQTSWFRGQIVVNELELEAVNIVNLTKEIGVVNNKSGYFEIPANIGDVIIFSSVQFKTKKLTITKEQLKSKSYRVFLESEINTLDEVHISQYSLTGDVYKDIEEIPTYEKNLPFWNAEQLKQMGVSRPNDEQSPVENTVLPSGNNQAGISVDLAGLIQAISGIFKKSSKKGNIEIKLTQYYREEFFIKELKIPETELYNFMDFLDQETNINAILSTRDGLKLLEFLIAESIVFKEKYNIEE